MNKEELHRHLEKIESFKTKIDELLSEGYNRILDDVLNAGQLKKYLNADW